MGALLLPAVHTTGYLAKPPPLHLKIQDPGAEIEGGGFASYMLYKNKGGGLRAVLAARPEFRLGDTHRQVQFGSNFDQNASFCKVL